MFLGPSASRSRWGGQIESSLGQKPRDAFEYRGMELLDVKGMKARSKLKRVLPPAGVAVSSADQLEGSAHTCARRLRRRKPSSQSRSRDPGRLLYAPNMNK